MLYQHACRRGAGVTAAVPTLAGARPQTSAAFNWRRLLVLLALAAALRLLLAALQLVPFNADEAVVGLMARHILAGERPVFFYGQA
jgi:hypothetical protein